MKRKFVLVLLLSMTCLTGCVEYKATMDIKGNKSMEFAVDYAIDTSVFGEDSVLDESDETSLETKGYKVEPYEHDSMKGFHITKSIDNIDKYSSEDDVKYYLSGILNEEETDVNIFKVKKGLFKNTYYADFDFDASDSGLSDNEAEEPTDDEDLTDEDLSDITSSLMSNLDLSFNVNLPYKALTNNASSVSEDGKTLSWSLSSNSVDNITFSFSLYNTGNILICIIILILLIGIIVFIIKKKGSSKNNIMNESAKEE